jgi:hypothetical protein
LSGRETEPTESAECALPRRQGSQAASAQFNYFDAANNAAHAGEVLVMTASSRDERQMSGILNLTNNARDILADDFEI